MNPAYIYFKELDIDTDNNFNLNFSKDNQIENVIFDKEYEYAITGLKINVKLPKGQVIKIEDNEKLNQKSKEIQVITKNYKEPDLTLYMSHPETLTIKIPFEKKVKLNYHLKSTLIITPQVKKKIFLYVII